MSTSIEPEVGHSEVLIYFLASPKDEDVCEAIHRHLTPIVRNSKIPIRVLDDFDIPAGSDRRIHESQLLNADIVLSLISADFIDDDDIYARNQHVIERYNKGETLMISILVRNCLWKASPLAQFPLLPKNLQPLNNKHFWNSEDDAVTAVVSDLYESINEILAEMSTLETVTPVETPPETPVGLDLTDTGRGGGPGLVGAASVLDADARGEVFEPEPAGDTMSPAAKLDTEPGADVVVELPATDPVAPPAPIQEPMAVETPETVPATFAIPRQAVTTPVDTDWRKRYYRRVLAKRAGALALDNLLLFLVPAFVLGMILAEASDETLDSAVNVLLWAGAFIFFFGAPALEASKWRATPGKRILKLEISTKEGERISYWRAFVRNVLRSLTLYSYLLLGIGLIPQYFRFRKTKKLFHDELSSTVIGERLATGSAPTSPAAAPAA
jgi:uncharacterized RDD family membrane protein YckC